MIITKELHPLRASQKQHFASMNFVLSWEPSAPLGTEHSLMIPIKSKGIFTWNVGYLTYVTIQWLILEPIENQVNLVKSNLGLYFWSPILPKETKGADLE